MSEFTAYLLLGYEHITDLNGYDHILFVIALCTVYTFRDWRRVLLLVTAFTIGHSVTLALATLHILVLPTEVIEFLIPVTILITACTNFRHKEPRAGLFRKESFSKYRYLLALFFGLIHGMGFSNYLRGLLGKEEHIAEPLLAFNLGLELGQILVVVLFLLLASLVTGGARVQRKSWNLAVSGMVAGMALSLILHNEWFRSWF